VEAAVTTASGPSDLTLNPGQTASFSTTASGSGPFTYQWTKDGVELVGATGPTYTIAAVSAGDAGIYCVMITGPCSSLINCATLSVSDCLSLTANTPKLNPQSGLFEQTVRVTNPTPSTLSAVQIAIRGLREGVRVHNATGDADGVPFVKYNQELGPGKTAELRLEYYVPDRRTPESQLCAQAASSSSSIQQDGTPVAIRGPITLANGARLIEFSAVPGQVYFIQYSDDLLHWKTVTPGVTSSANQIQWIDNGPPKTDSFPSDGLVRYYRVITVR
jgi:hypothetical protein